MAQKNDDVQILVRCSSTLRERVSILAENKGQSVTEWVRRAIIQQVEREENPEKTEFMLTDTESLDDRIATVILSMKKEGII